MKAKAKAKKPAKKKKPAKRKGRGLRGTGLGASQGTPSIPEGIKTERGGGRAPSTSDAAIQRILQRSKRKRSRPVEDDLLSILGILGA